MKKNISKLFIAVLLVFTSLVGCDEKLDVLDENNPTTESYFKTAIELQNGVNAIYSTLRSAQLVGREWFFTHDMRSGECSPGGAQLEAPRAELLKATFTGTIQFRNVECVDRCLSNDQQGKPGNCKSAGCNR